MVSLKSSKSFRTIRPKLSRFYFVHDVKLWYRLRVQNPSGPSGQSKESKLFERATLDLLPSDIDKREQSPSMEASVGGMGSNPSCKGHPSV